ncbi:hypothetical protein [Frateuria defendens]|uniref:hypothetical protein n=1 Tax=Frateuria defendens TaxID=2219559 RepID=UPI00066FD589|nr:hypothetical protein [Frateuria defendens]
MASSRRLIHATCLAVLLHAGGCVASPLGSSAKAELPNDKVIQAFAGGAQAEFPGESKAGAVSLYDRIMDGFELGPQRLVLGDGSAIYWGAKYQEAFLQSVIISDATGKIRLLATVDNITAIARGSKPLATSMEQYQEKLKKAERDGSSPLVSVFVRDERDLAGYMPYLKRFVQASLLGFNAHCDKSPGMAQACELAGQIDIPLRLYALSGSKPVTHALSVPDVAAASVPLESFRW